METLFVYKNEEDNLPAVRCSCNDGPPTLKIFFSACMKALAALIKDSASESTLVTPVHICNKSFQRNE